MFMKIIKIFQVAGIYPVRTFELTVYQSNVEEKRFYGNLLTFWSFFNLTIVLSLIIAIGMNNQIFFYDESSIGNLSDILVYYSLLFAHLVIIIESLRKRKHLVKYWKFYTRSLRISKMFRQNIWIRKLFMKVLIHATITCLFELIIYIGITSDREWTLFWSAEVFSLMITRLHNLLHIFLIDVIFFTLQDMNSRLKSDILWLKVIGEDKKFTKKFLYKNIKAIKTQFKNVMEMVLCVNRYFRWTQVFNMGQTFIEITSELYWVYVFSVKVDTEFLWACLVPFIPSIIMLFTLFASATRCIKEAHEKLAFNINHIDVFIDDRELRSLIMEFSLLIAQSPKYFTARNFFMIDYTLAGKMLSAVLTYLVIFISFEPR